MSVFPPPVKSISFRKGCHPNIKTTDTKIYNLGEVGVNFNFLSIILRKGGGGELGNTKMGKMMEPVKTRPSLIRLSLFYGKCLFAVNYNQCCSHALELTSAIHTNYFQCYKKYKTYYLEYHFNVYKVKQTLPIPNRVTKNIFITISHTGG